MKTSELTGVALDWAVALIEFPDPDYEDADRMVYVEGVDEFHFTPSTNWAQGGPIIEEELIELTRRSDLKESWGAYSEVAGDDNWDANICYGPTPLIAAMRCYVASKLGETIDIPKELTS